jgi:GNAT superfamily N-acetyltransferase
MPAQKSLLDSQQFSSVLAAELVAIQERRDVLRDPSKKTGIETKINADREEKRQKSLLDSQQPFSVLAAKLAAIKNRRGALHEPVKAPEVEQENNDDSEEKNASLVEIENQKTQRLKALNMHLAGLSISGGGIRSATFGLGLLQGLAELDLLKRFDYISTVSGGGYIGSWLTGWTKREGDPENVHRQLRPSRVGQSEATRPPFPIGQKIVVDEEPEPVHHLRSYSNYLAPRAGLLTADTWSLIATYGRNLLVNFLILVPATVFLVTLIRLGVWFFRVPEQDFAGSDGNHWIWVLGLATIFFLALSIAFGVIATELFKIQEARGVKQKSRIPERVKWIGWAGLAILFSPLAIVILVNARAILAWVFRSREHIAIGISVVLLAGVGIWFMAVVQKNLKSTTVKPRGVFWILVWIIVPLLISAVLSCWLFSLEPAGDKDDGVEHGVISADLDRDAVYDSNPDLFESRLCALGYSVLTARPHPFLKSLASQQPKTIQEGLQGWGTGVFYWWPAIQLMVFFGALHGLIHLLINWFVLVRLMLDKTVVTELPVPSLRRLKIATILAVVPFLSGALGGFLFYVLVVKGLWVWHHQPYAIVTFGPPLAFLLFCVAAALEIGLLGERLEEDEREWWARIGALVLIAATLWLMVFSAVLYVPWLIEYLGDNLGPLWVKSGLTIGWLATAIGGAIAGRSARTGNEQSTGKGLVELLCQVAPWVFVVGLLAAISMLVSWGVDVDPFWVVENGGRGHDHWAGVALAGFTPLSAWCVGSFLFAWLMSALVDVNLFSLHNMYANRLIRCYLGASRRKAPWRIRWGGGPRPYEHVGAPTKSLGGDRQENPISGFDFDDDIPLVDLRHGWSQLDSGRPGYWGPFPLINTALNLVATHELDWQERKAESFLLSPIYCGSQTTGYQELPDDFRRGNMTLGRAMAVSGAAADPNMGHHQSPPVTALMTVFNTRLGWWIENPSRPLWSLELPQNTHWSAESPSFGGLILKELLGRTDASGHWVHLSDGGHFENLAVYELIRRRCRFIVVSDAGCDPALAFEDLANLIRKCRTDFGIRIEIDTAPILRQLSNDCSRWHCAVGKIRYDDVDGGEVPGILVYVKASLTGDESPDLQQYTKRFPDFPHQTTADQFFDETQFESYRALGYHVALDIFKDAASDDEPGESIERWNQRFFSRVRSRWFPAPPDLEENFEKIAEAFERLQTSLRMDHNARAFTYDLYPELGKMPSDRDLKIDPVDRACAEFHAVNQVVLLMEKAWITVKVEGFPEHPMNRGWMNLFRRCASCATIRRYWPALRGMFSQEFVRFCERDLQLPGLLPKPQRFDPHNADHAEAFKAAKDEFGREWPSLLAEVNKKLAEVNKKHDAAVNTWLIRYDASDPFTYGFAFFNWAGVPWASNVYEFLVWVRPAYRNLGIGQKCLEDLLNNENKLAGTDGGKFTLRVRYPKYPSGGDKVRLELWKSYHFSQDFRPAEEDPYFLVLERRFFGAS